MSTGHSPDPPHPCCWEEIVLELDLSGGSAVYTEDCSACCRPMVVRLSVGEEGEFEVQVESEES